MKTFEEAFEKILKGDKEESRLASLAVRKILYNPKRTREDFSSIKKIVNEAFWNYWGIEEDWRQENFVRAVSVIYFLRDKEVSLDLFLPWFVQLLKHKNGNIRHAAVRMIDNELGPLTYHLRFPKNKTVFKNVNKNKNNDRLLFSLFLELINLLDIFDDFKYEKYKYVHEIPSSPYKSVQIILANMEHSCGADYLDRFKELARTMRYSDMFIR